MPPERFPVTEFIIDELDERGWTPTDLARESGLGMHIVGPVLAGRRPVSRLVAYGLGEAFGTSADLWINLAAR